MWVSKNGVISDNICVCSAHFEGHIVHPEAVPTISPSKTAPPVQPRHQIHCSCAGNGDGMTELTAVQESSLSDEEHETGHPAPPQPLDVILLHPQTPSKEIGVQVPVIFCHLSHPKDYAPSQIILPLHKTIFLI